MSTLLKQLGIFLICASITGSANAAYYYVYSVPQSCTSCGGCGEYKCPKKHYKHHHKKYKTYSHTHKRRSDYHISVYYYVGTVYPVYTCGGCVQPVVVPSCYSGNCCGRMPCDDPFSEVYVREYYDSYYDSSYRNPDMDMSTADNDY